MNLKSLIEGIIAGYLINILSPLPKKFIKWLLSDCVSAYPKAKTIKHRRLKELTRCFNFCFIILVCYLWSYISSFRADIKVLHSLFLFGILLVLHGSFDELIDYAAGQVQNTCNNSRENSF